MVTDEQARRFSRLYQGYSKAYGQYDTKLRVQENGKNVGRAWTVPAAPSLEIYREHLDGIGNGLGILMLQDDNTCRFGAIDVDDYNVDHQRLCRQIAKLKIPLVVCRTKSGGAHLYVFTYEDVPATMLRDRIAEWTAALGLSAKTEQFPKQTSRANADETGNWINLPYQNAERTVRFGYSESGEALDLEQFLDWAESRTVGIKDLQSPFFEPVGEEDLFHEGPPCLVMLHRKGGFAEGTRNEGMFAVGVYLKKRYGDAWSTKMDQYNREMANLGASEIVALTKSLNKKDYQYTCKKEPCASVCQRRTCLSREYGVGEHGAASLKVEILNLSRYDAPHPDPPVWSFEINGKRVMVDNDTFYNRDTLNKAILSQANCVPLQMSPNKWLRLMNNLIQQADVLSMPEDASPTGQLWERVVMFLEQGVNAMTRDEVLTGKVMKEEGRAYFRSIDLFQYLNSRHVKFKSEAMVWQALRAHGADKVVWKIGNKSANVWYLPFEQPNLSEPQQVEQSERIEEF